MVSTHDKIALYTNMIPIQWSKEYPCQIVDVRNPEMREELFSTMAMSKVRQDYLHRMAHMLLDCKKVRGLSYSVKTCIYIKKLFFL